MKTLMKFMFKPLKPVDLFKKIFVSTVALFRRGLSQRFCNCVCHSIQICQLCKSKNSIHNLMQVVANQ